MIIFGCDAVRGSPEEAVFDMEALDHDFFLFRNAESGEENVVYRMSDGGYELIQPTARTGGTDFGRAPIRPGKQVPPRSRFTTPSPR